MCDAVNKEQGKTGPIRQKVKHVHVGTHMTKINLLLCQKITAFLCNDFARCCFQRDLFFSETVFFLSVVRIHGLKSEMRNTKLT